MPYAVTFDFHNTLARCDSWFELEVRRLVPAFLQWHATESRDDIDPATLEAAAASYRDLRREIIQHGNELTAEQCVATVLDRLGLSATEAEIARGVESLMRAASADLAPIPGAIDLVRALRKEGIILGVVSSAVHHPFLEWSLASFGILDAFSNIVTSASAGYYKSRTEIYSHALDSLGVSPDGAIHIGDSLKWDVSMAKRAGMKTIWLNPMRLSSDQEPDLDLTTLVGALPNVLTLMCSDRGAAS